MRGLFVVKIVRLESSDRRNSRHAAGYRETWD